MRTNRLRYRPHNGAGPTKNNPHKGMKAFLLSDQARDPAVKASHDIAAAAAGLAPRSQNEGPHMADQFEVNEHPAPVMIAGNLRVGAEVYNSNPAAAPNEFGGKRNKRHRMLARAGQLFGDMNMEIG